jgi:hypothetical protein
MSAREVVATAVPNIFPHLSPFLGEAVRMEVVDKIIDALSADPVAVLSLLPADLLADIRACANMQAASLAWEPGERVLDVLARVPS